MRLWRWRCSDSWISSGRRHNIFMAGDGALNFEQFVRDAAEKGELVNLMFEQRLFDLVGVLQKITDPLMAGNVPHELIGGLAVLVHVEEADPGQSILTRDVDLLIYRDDLERVKELAAGHGFRFRHAAG